MLIKAQKTPDGKYTINVGGGAYTKGYTFCTVVDKSGNLKPAAFIRTAGDLACRHDQGSVEIEEGDRILIGSGFLPISPFNPGAIVKAYRIISIGWPDRFTVLTDEGSDYPIGVLPSPVITGASLYHNRDGSFFCEGITS